MRRKKEQTQVLARLSRHKCSRNPAGYFIFERHVAAWLGSVCVGQLSEMHGFSLWVESAARGGVTQTTVKYAHASNAWKHSFSVVSSGEASLDCPLQPIGFGPLTWLDQAHRWASVSRIRRPAVRVACLAIVVLLAASQPPIALARANDQQAGMQCKTWREAIAPGGPLETGLPVAVLGAKRILEMESAPRK